MPSSRANDVFRANVQFLLDERGMSQRDLAAAVGVKPPTLSTILRGKEGVTLDRAERIAEALGVPLSALLTDLFVAAKRQRVPA